VRAYLCAPRSEAVEVNACLPKLKVSSSDEIDDKFAHLLERYKKSRTIK
jgi:hypothetical protein